MADENGADALDDAALQGGDDAGDDAAHQADAHQPDKSFDVEDFAGRMGWSPQDQWRGPPEAWKPAAEFIEGTVSVNQALSKKLKNLERNQSRMVQTVERIAEQRIADARAELEAQLDQAVDEGDKATVKHVTTRIAQLDREAPASDPDVADFVERHSDWFNVDPEATALAMGVADNLHRQGKTAAEQVAAAEKAVKKRFPELFDEPPPRQQGKGPAAVHTADTRSAPRQQRGPKGFAELPADAKTAALRMESKGRCSRDEYAKFYWQENA
jgi:hypothetical protein